MKSKWIWQWVLLVGVTLATMLLLLASTRMGQKKYYPFPGDENVQVLFLGDSNMAYSFDNASIPDMLKETGNYTVYNGAIGGSGAAKWNGTGSRANSDDLFGFYQLMKMAQAGDMQPVIALETEANGEAMGRVDMLTDLDWKELDIVIISYGLNDYMAGVPLDYEGNAYLENTYAGALRKGIATVNEMCDATIILSSITYASFEEGEGRISGYEKDFGGGTIDAYRDACRDAAAEFDNVVFLDALGEMGIDDENYGEYLIDEIHLNESGRQRYLDCLLPLLKER